MTLRLSGLLAATLMLLVGCGSGESPAPAAPAAPTAAASAVAPAAPPSPAASEPEAEPTTASPVSFETELEFIHDVYGLTVHGEGNRKLLVLAAKRNGEALGAPVNGRFQGDIANAYAADLNGDQQAEVLLFTRGRTPEAAGEFVGYSLQQDHWVPLGLPALDAEQAAGYQGGDTFALEGGQLHRRFKLGSGPNAGKTLHLAYALQPDLTLTVAGSQLE